MRFLDRLERKYHKYAIHNLMKYVAIGMGIVFVFGLIDPNIIDLLGFSPTWIVKGQFWRIITFAFVPRVQNPIWIIFSLLIMYFFGRVLEENWGAFKFNLYYFIGSIGTILAGITIESLSKVLSGTWIALPLTNYYLYMTLLLAVAQIMPDYEIRVYFVLPVKLKYIGWIYSGILIFEFLTGNIFLKIVILFSLLNYFIFFGPDLIRRIKQKNKKNTYKRQHKPPVRKRQKYKEGQVIQVAFHCCEVCGRTEKDDAELEFRYCSKCEGRYEYCSDHIFSHEHKKE